MAITELTNETKKDEDLLGGDKGILSDQSFIPGNGGLITTSIPKAGDFLDYTVGALTNARLKTYFNIQLLFILWTGSTSGALTTNFTNWNRVSDTEIFVPPMGATSDFRGVGNASINLASVFTVSNSLPLQWDDTRKVILDWWARLPVSSAGDIQMGFSNAEAAFRSVYDDFTNGKATFAMRGSTGVIYATISDDLVGNSQIDVSSGVTTTNWNNYRIELDLSNNALFYINGVLKATLSGTNFTTTASAVQIGFGRTNTSLFQVTAPNLSLEMNP